MNNHTPKFKVGDILNSANDPRFSCLILRTEVKDSMSAPAYEVEIFYKGKRGKEGLFPSSELNVAVIPYDGVDTWGILAGHVDSISTYTDIMELLIKNPLVIENVNFKNLDWLWERIKYQMNYNASTLIQAECDRAERCKEISFKSQEQESYTFWDGYENCADTIRQNYSELVLRDASVSSLITKKLQSSRI